MTVSSALSSTTGGSGTSGSTTTSPTTPGAAASCPAAPDAAANCSRTTGTTTLGAAATGAATPGPAAAAPRRLHVGADGRLRHRIGIDEISNDLADWIAEDLVAPGLLDAGAFEPTFVSIVHSVAPDPGAAWTAFYRNTLAELAAGGTPGGTNAGMAPVHQRAVELAFGDVVELGCCFGFLSLRLAAAGHTVTAVDLSPGTVRLLASVAPALGAPLRALAGDALAVPLADRCADTVFAVHLLEHLPPGADEVVLAEMLRLARRRVVVAVPYEDEPNPTWGHIRTFDAAALRRLGETTGRPFEVTEHHGGWLVVNPVR